MPAENICALVRITEPIPAGSQLLLNYGNAYWTDVKRKQGTTEPRTILTETDNTDNHRFSVKNSTLPFQGAGQEPFSKVTLQKGDYTTMTDQDRNTNSDQICLLTQEEYESKYPNNDATHVLMVEGVTRNTDGKKSDTQMQLMKG